MDRFVAQPLTVMDEPVLFNRSGFEAEILPILDRDGAQSRIVLVKATYTMRVGGQPTLSEEPRAIRHGDEPWGAPEIADIRLPGDLCAAKPGTDFIVSGHAVPRQQRFGTHVDVAVQVANRTKTMRVHGERDWKRTIAGVVPGPSAPMQPTPLAWSRAYGGSDLTDPSRPLEDARNPVGSGIARDVSRLIGTPAPQIEAPDAPIGAAGGRFLPVGCAPLGRNFEPRRKTMGTYDEAWLGSVYPARPADYHEEHENCAPPDFVFREPLIGGEPVMVSGVHREGPLQFNLPKHRIVVDALIDGTIVERRPHLDTVVVDSDAMVLELVWRALYRCPVKMRNRFTVVRVHRKEFLN
jgi:hypothetical protein